MSRIVGIDLGTSTSEISVFMDGKPCVIPNHIGEYITPSVVGISDEGIIIAGKEAQEQFLLKPEDTVMEVKRLMGTNMKVSMGGNEYSPQEISSYILKYLIQCAENYLGEKVERAVITVPAYFSDEQRKATVEAGKLAGVKVERIINEPTAASLDYGIDHMEECKNILVYDLGGGTLDVTVLEMFEGVMDVKASSGNNRLGGKDFDNDLMDFCLEKFTSKYEIDVSGDKRAMMRLKRECEKCKIALSINYEYSIVLPFFAEVDKNPVSLEEVIDRELFESLIKSKIYSTRDQIQSALKDSGLTKEDVDFILLVGGSTRIPLVKKFIENELGKIPGSHVDPDLAVVRGASIQAGILNDEISSKDGILITDVCPYTLGVSVLGYIGGIPVDDIFDVIIPRNITIPVTKEKIYGTVQDNQTAVEIKVYQGENKKASANNFLGNFMIENIPPEPAFKQKVNIAFSYDTNGILQVEGTIVNTGEKVDITVETTGVEMVKEIDLDAWKDAPDSRKYRAVINKAEKLINNDEAELHEIDMDMLIRQIKKGLLEGEDKAVLNKYKDELSEILYAIEEEEDDL
ncbi:MAG: Hsp70 family protein [Firmicutes bacterium]|nr:Hsp70 family protein [Bacillota bacterium]